MRYFIPKNFIFFYFQNFHYIFMTKIYLHVHIIFLSTPTQFINFFNSYSMLIKSTKENKRKCTSTKGFVSY